MEKGKDVVVPGLSAAALSGPGLSGNHGGRCSKVGPPSTVLSGRTLGRQPKDVVTCPACLWLLRPVAESRKKGETLQKGWISVFAN